MPNEKQTYGTEWPLTPNYETPTGTDSYKTAEDFGANYGLFGQIGDWLLGTNKAAESEANAYNTARTEAFNAEQAQIARDFSATEAEKDRKYNAEQAQISREWQKMMSDTSMQRMMSDAKAAGINPLYLIGNAGASTPGGATASSSGSETRNASSRGMDKLEGKRKNKNAADNIQTAAVTALTLARLFMILAA